MRCGTVLATTPHPHGLGSALTHPYITTDFSESQLELITGVHPDAQACVDELTRIQQFTMRELGDEMMWVSSMPCGLPQDDAIPLGQYGSSNVGQSKTVYRRGLGYRYGRRMQTISGIHRCVLHVCRRAPASVAVAQRPHHVPAPCHVLAYGAPGLPK